MPSSSFTFASSSHPCQSENNEDEVLTPFEELPLELMLIVFRSLSKTAKQACRLVCQEWRQIIDVYFARFVGFLNDQTFECICASNLHFETIIVNSFHRVLSDRDVRSSFRSKLALSPENLIFTYGSLEHSNAGTTSADNVAAMLKLNRKISSLRFRQNALKGIRRLPILKLLLPNLTKLEITINREMMYETEIFQQIAEIRMPCLTRVAFHIAKFIVFEHEKSGRFYFAMFEFVVKHRATLTSLDMRNDYYLFFPLITSINIPLPVSPAQLDSLTIDLLQVKLKEFSYLFKRPESQPPYNLGTLLFDNQSELQKLKIEERNDNGRLHPVIFRTIERNSKTLQQFFWRISRFASNIPFTDISPAFVQQLKLCSSLESLSLCGFRITDLSSILNQPEKLKILELEGAIDSNVLVDIHEHCINLESLKFYHLSVVERSQYDALANNLKAVMRLPKLRLINWYVQGLFLHYIPKRTDICIKRGKKGRHYYVITFTR